MVYVHKTAAAPVLLQYNLKQSLKKQLYRDRKDVAPKNAWRKNKPCCATLCDGVFRQDIINSTPHVQRIAIFKFIWQQRIRPVLITYGSCKTLDTIGTNSSKPAIGCSRE